MGRVIERIVIVGGGTAGWLSASMIAAFARRQGRPLAVTLIEAPDIPTVGVGEGTWPTMRRTLEDIGIGEAEFLIACDGAFKQGSRFDGWVSGGADDSYYHPFTLPPAGDAANLISAWRAQRPPRPFAEAITAQTQACRLGLAPRQRQMPAYSGALNYAYHLDAAKLAALLSRHAVQRLGVTHIADLVTGVEAGEDGRVLGVRTRDHGTVGGELFIDCSGHAALLIGGHCGVEWVSRSGTLFNDRALAAQVPVAADSRIESQTIGTAHAAGWLWDIGLPARRGIGCVYASEFMSDEQALDVLRGYISREVPDADAAAITPRQLSFPTGHRARFWDRNCIAIGLSAGFVEPLEASAIVMIELSLRALLDNFPASDEVLPLHAERFNQLFRTRWDRIVEFLKLHYLLSRRDEPYWQKHRDPQTVPERLSSLMRLWQDQPPSAYDFPLAEEIFPAASFQYVYYGMGGALVADDASPLPSAAAQIEQVQQRARGLAAALPTNRAYLHGLRAGGRVAEPREQAV